jgi:phosphatidylserine decarboxylase
MSTRKNVNIEKIWDRGGQLMISKQVYGESILNFLHANPIGKFLMNHIFSSRLSNQVINLYNYTKMSRQDIGSFVDKYRIDSDELEKPLKEFKNFGEFFIRRLKPGTRPFDDTANSIIAPCDCLIQSINLDIGESTRFMVKGGTFLLEELVEDSTLAARFKGGSLIVFYLAPYNTHHFVYPVSGKLTRHYRLGKKYFSVNSISIKNGFNPFFQNRRDVSLILTDEQVPVLMVEVGGFYAGRIIQENIEPGSKLKGDQKGYFELGGSTVVMTFPKGKINLDEDLLGMEKDGVATLLKQGERIGLI